MSKFLNKDFLNKIITSVFFVWLLSTFIGTINDSNLNPWGLTHNVLVMLLIILLVIFLYKKVSIKSKKIILFFFLFLGLVYQLMIIFTVTGELAFDFSFVHEGMINFDSSRSYLKINSNNLFIILFQHSLLRIFHLSSSWITANIINLICIDLSFIINIFTIKIINRKYLYYIIIIQIFLMFLLPQVLVPYTDTMVLPFVSMYIFGFFLLKKSYKSNMNYLFTGCFLFSLGSFLSYEMKPSAIVPMIAMLILSLCFYTKKCLYKNNTIKNLFSISILILIFFIGIFSFNYVRDNILKVDVSGEFPISHYAAMGITGHGVYNADITIPLVEMKNKKEQDKYSKNIINNQLKNYGALGFVQFLICKNYDNTSDGTLGWYRFDRYFVHESSDHIIQNIYYQNGKYFHDYQFVAQVFWIGMVGLLVIGTCRVDDITQLLRVGLMGGLLFLLVFEGGRSRYLIQFLPFIIILNGITLPYSLDLLKKIKKTIKENKY